MGATALCYQLSGTEKGKKIAQVLQTLKYEVIFVEPASYHIPIGVLAKSLYPGSSQPSMPLFGASIPEEMLVLRPNGELHFEATLQALRKKKLNIPLKALVTTGNQNWSSVKLYRELKAEQASFGS